MRTASRSIFAASIFVCLAAAMFAADSPAIQAPPFHPMFIPVTSVAGAGTANAVTKWLDSAGTLGDSTISESSGVVSIGTTAAAGQLRILGPVTADVFAGMGFSISGGPAMNFGYGGTSFGRGAGFFNVRPDASAVAPNPSLRFMTNNSQRMIITNTGNVGIGTLSPGYPLQVNGVISSLSGGFRFPDNSVQTTAATPFTVPYSASVNSTSTLFSINNPNTADGSAATFSSSSTVNPAVTINAQPPGGGFNGGGGLVINYGGLPATGIALNAVGTTAGNGMVMNLNGSGVGLAVSNPYPSANGGVSVILSGSNSGAAFQASAFTQGLEIDAGGVIVSTAATNTIAATTVLTEIQNNGVAASKPTSALPTVVIVGRSLQAGQLIMVSCADPDGCNVTGAQGGTVTVGVNAVLPFVYTPSGVWKQVL